MKLTEIILNKIHEYLNENIQLADKIYFKTGKLTDEDKEIILNTTKGDNFTKIVSDLFFILKENYYREEIIKKIKKFHENLKSYNKDVFPIKGFNYLNIKGDVFELELILNKREKLLKLLKELPSVAIRNFKTEIRKERDMFEFNHFYKEFEYFMLHYKQLSNRSDDIKLKFINKMFKSNTTMEDLNKFVDDKSSFIGGVEFTKEKVREMSKYEDFDIVFEKDNVMIVEVGSPDGIKSIGCNSLWCFTYGKGFESAYSMWNSYSYNDIVYVIIDFTQQSNWEDFMYVLIKPLTDKNNRFIKFGDDDDNYPLYNMANENYHNPYYVLKGLFGENYKKIIRKYLNFD